MILKKLKLIGFRNYDNIVIDFEKGINYIFGNNAEGKTNLVEAIYYLSFGKSFRTNDITQLIKKNNKDFFIEGKVFNRDISNSIIGYFNSLEKKFEINNRRIGKISELSEVINVILFTPQDVNLFKDSPLKRRQLLNNILSKNYKEYQNNLLNYEKILKSRNELLKNEYFDLNLFNSLTKQLINYMKIIYSYRKKLIFTLNNLINKVYKEIDNRNLNIKIEYIPFIDNLENYYNLALNQFKNKFNEEKNKKMTLLGIHKEDFKIYLNDKDIGIYGSQGENRIIVLSLKLALYFLKNDYDIKAIMILDDVFSELDKNHENLLIKFLKNFEQVFITNTKNELEFDGNKYIVNNNNVELLGGKTDGR